jgi:hypothetical protein
VNERREPLSLTQGGEPHRKQRTERGHVEHVAVECLVPRPHLHPDAASVPTRGIVVYRLRRLACRALHTAQRCTSLPLGLGCLRPVTAFVCTLLTAAGFYFSIGLGEQWWLAWLAPVPVLWFAFSDTKGWQVFLAEWAAYALGATSILKAYGGILPLGRAATGKNMSAAGQKCADSLAITDIVGETHGTEYQCAEPPLRARQTSSRSGQPSRSRNSLGFLGAGSVP